ncbi:hypothetical protein [Mycoplasma mycoides]|uniref:hypothetical protein n=1 Tax=Mycoplasma mycoides TaxID=2102 RepID=UPI00223FF8D8|nr:hypothetical protein [Mycoplasma mycoides]QVK04871.1 hypothetical protein I7640_02325 [Mycoplasma mycoides subsp. capri]
MSKELTVSQFFLVTVQQHLINNLLEENKKKSSKNKTTKSKIKVYTKTNITSLIDKYPLRFQEMIYDLFDINNWSELKEFLNFRNEEIKNEMTPPSLITSQNNPENLEIVEQLKELVNLMTSINLLSLTYESLDDIEYLFPKLGENELIKNVNTEDISYLFDNLLNKLIESVKEEYLKYFDEDQQDILLLFDSIKSTNISLVKKTLLDKLFKYFESKKIEFSDSFMSDFLYGNPEKLIAGYRIVRNLIRIDFLISLSEFILLYMAEIIKK